MEIQATQWNVAVVGAGMAGATCAHALSSAGHSVRVFDKARGAGGRMASRRVEWVDRDGHARNTQLDHGAVVLTARSANFQEFAAQAVQARRLSEWKPSLAVGSLALDDGGPFYLPVPDMPALCRSQLEGITATWSCAVDSLHRSSRGWQVEAGGVRMDQHFDAVVLALPPAQAAPLLLPHRRDWSETASLAPMQPCWTLMGVADEAVTAPDPVRGADLARPPHGILDWVVRNDARPGRQRAPGEAHWVVHARADWSREHLEQPAPWIQARMQAALAEWLGRPVEWRHCAVHRWRYALPDRSGAAPAVQCWWDAAQGLGVCGDFLGNSGVEGAWLSAQSLAAELLASAASGAMPCAPARSAAPAVSERTTRLRTHDPAAPVAF